MSGVVGRFAPSPSGPLHFGSVAAAVGSYLQARSRGGRWLLRIDDLDPPREQPGAADSIIKTLEALALEWDGEIVYQSRRGDAYQAALGQLAALDASFPCGCTRAMVGRGPYPGTCRDGLPAGRQARSIRVRAADHVIEFDDLWRGFQRYVMNAHCGDFVIRRADGLIAYHLAVVVDDAHAGVNEIVRGADLLDSTPQQIHLQNLLGLPRPRYAHLPVVLGDNGRKLSKQTFARPVSAREADTVLFHALDFLGLAPPPALAKQAPREQLAWALEHWPPVGGPAESRRYSLPEAPGKPENYPKEPLNKS